MMINDPMHDWNSMLLWLCTKRPARHIKAEFKSNCSRLAVHWGIGPMDELAFDVLQQRFALIADALKHSEHSVAAVVPRTQL
jgi:hypothetical protein